MAEEKDIHEQCLEAGVAPGKTQTEELRYKAFEILRDFNDDVRQKFQDSKENKPIEYIDYDYYISRIIKLGEIEIE